MKMIYIRQAYHALCLKIRFRLTAASGELSTALALSFTSLGICLLK